MPKNLRTLLWSVIVLLGLVVGFSSAALRAEEPVRELTILYTNLYQTFLQTKQKDTGTALSDLVIEYFRKRGSIARPILGRLVRVAASAPQKREASTRRAR